MSKSAADRRYINTAQQRVLRTLTMLCGHELDGLAPGEIAKALRCAPPNTTRDLANLREAGLAECLESGRWRVTPRVAQMAFAVAKSLDDARARVDEITQRYTRSR